MGRSWLWLRLHSGLCALSTRCSHIIATPAGRNIQRDEPQLVIEVIVDVVTQVRSLNASSGPRQREPLSGSPERPIMENVSAP